MSGSQNITNKAPKAASIRAMTSAYGRVIPLVYGKSRVQANVIYYTDFTATENKTTTKSGGKGGGSVKQTNITYTYSVCTLLALCEGVASGIGTVWNGKSKGNLSDFGLSWLPGSETQSALGYISTNHPAEALNYRNTVYVGAGQLELGDDPSIPNVNVEVAGRFSAIDVGTSGSEQANPANVILDLITDKKSCLGLGNNTQGLDDVKAYCQANQLFVSPVYTEAKPASEMIKNLCTIANTAVYFSEGKIKFVPLGTVATTANGASYTPNLTAAYDLTEDQIKDDIKIFIKSQDDCYNHVKVSYQNNAKDYNDDVVSAKDQAAILKFGERLLSEVSLPEINSTDVAGAVAQNILRSKAHVKKTFEFKLGWQFSRLEPTDILRITYPKLNLDNFAVRITEIEETDDGFYIKAEEFLAGIVGVSRYTIESSNGYAINYNTPPGNVNTPFVFDVPTSLSDSPEIWMAVSGVDEDNWGGCNVWVSEDNATYKRIGTISGASRHGVTTATLPAGSAIDTANTLAVSLISQGEQLDSGTTQAALDFETLLLVEDELLAYRDATLTGADAYNLQYLVRGAYGSPIKSHASGVKFARLDNMIFKYSYDPDVWLARTMYIKFQSFNVYGSAFQDLAGLTAYTHNIANVGTQIGSVANLVLTQPFVGDYLRVKWDAVKGAKNYQVEVRNLAGTTTYRTVLTYETQFEYSWQDSKADGGPYRDLRVYVKALSANGESGNYSFVSAQNFVPAGLTGISITGGYGVIFFEWNPDTSPDILGYQVWMSATSGFTPGSGNLLYDGTDNKGSTRTLPGGAAVTPGTTYYFRVAAYDKYGKTGLNVSSEFSVAALAIAAGIQPGEITATLIANGALDMNKFASGIRPPRVVTSLPVVDGTNYKNQDQVVLTTDGKIYRVVGGAWTADIPAANVSGQLTNSQIADLAATKISGQLTNAQIADLASTKITGQLTNSQIADLAATKITGQITTTQITDSAISTPKLAAGSVVAGKIAADAVTANEIAANAVTSAKINAGAVVAGKIAAGAVTAGTIAANTVTATEISAGAITTGKIAAGAVTANEIAANAVTAAQIQAGAVITAKVAAGAITANEIAANTITAAKIAAGAIGATQIAANAVTAEKLLIKSNQPTINFDPMFEDPSSWGFYNSGGTISFASNTGVTGASGNTYVICSTGGADAQIYTLKRMPISPSKTYLLTANLFAQSGNNRNMYIFVNFFDNAGSAITGSGWGGSMGGYTYGGNPPVDQWTRQGDQFGNGTPRPIPSNARSCDVGIWFQYSGGGSSSVQQAAQDLRFEEVVGATLIKDGAITTDKIAANAITAGKIAANTITATQIAGNTITGDKVAAGTITASNIDSRGLTIKDSGGAIIFSAGVPLDAAYAANNIKNSTISLNSNGTLNGAGGGAVTIGGLGYTGDLNATNGATIGVNLSGQITAGNASTFIANAAIGAAQIGSLNANVINAGSLDASYITAGTITTNRIQVGAVTANSHFSQSSTSTVGATSTKAIELSLGSFTSTGVDANINCSCVMELGGNFSSAQGLTSSTAFATATVYLKVDGVNKVVNSITANVIRVGSTYYAWVPFSFTFRGAFTAGLHSVSARFEANFLNSTGSSVNQSSSTECTLRANCLVQENKV